MAGITGNDLIKDVISEGATRTTAEEIIKFLNSVIIVDTPCPTGCTCDGDAIYCPEINIAWDIDGNENVDYDTDGQLVSRYLFGVTGEALIKDLISPSATRTTAEQITQLVDNYKENKYLDVDGNGESDALSDGILIHRYMAGIIGNDLIKDVISEGATRTTAEEIIKFLNSIPTQTYSCSDSDGGLNYYTKGAIGMPCATGATCGITSDYCQSEIILIEHFCSGDTIANEQYECPNGCDNGACKIISIPNPEPPCPAGCVCDGDVISCPVKPCVECVDINGDGAVTPTDVISVINRLGTCQKSMDGSYSKYDINHDDCITEEDAECAKNQLGEKVSCTTNTCPEKCICKGNTISCPIETTTGGSGKPIEDTSVSFEIESKNATITQGDIETQAININIEEEKITMETTSGVKLINVLPDKARKISKIEAVQTIQLEEKKSKPVYTITGTKPAKLFAFISVDMYVVTEVNAETGNVVSEKKPWWGFLAAE